MKNIISKLNSELKILCRFKINNVYFNYLWILNLDEGFNYILLQYNLTNINSKKIGIKLL